MSLVVAKQEGNNILIVSDTKLSSPNPTKDEDERQKESPKNGILKSMIINEKVCISFAGGEINAEDAVRIIKPNDSVETMLEVLFRHHKSSDNNTEFILCSNLDSPCIFEIKHNCITKTISSWIGDIQAFECFQKNMLEKVENISQSISIVASMTTSTFDKAIKAMEAVINDATIESVGGYRVSISLKQNKFTYDFYIQSHFGPMNIFLKGGEFHPLSHDTAANGGYTLTFIGASNDFQNVAFHVKQGNLGVIYCRENAGLLRPELKPDIDEVDFHDYIIEAYSIHPLFSTQNRFQKFKEQAVAIYKSKDFKNAIPLFDKALNECRNIETEQAEILFYKGVSLHYLQNPDAAKIFNEAVKIDIKYQQLVYQFLKEFSKRRQ